MLVGDIILRLSPSMVNGPLDRLPSLVSSTRFLQGCLKRERSES